MPVVAHYQADFQPFEGSKGHNGTSDGRSHGRGCCENVRLLGGH